MYRVEFFANDTLDTTGYGEGQIFIGSKDVTTGAGGNANFNAAFPQIGAGQRVTATATDPNGNTSEFSGAVGQLLNVSTRLKVLTGSSVLIGGFFVGGRGTLGVRLRAPWPQLGSVWRDGLLGGPRRGCYTGAP